MKNVLVINASPNQQDSQSRMMTERFVRLWAQQNPADTFTFRELGNAAFPHVDQQWIKAAFTADEAKTADDKHAIALSDSLVTELQNADVIVLGSPVHNLSVPSTLKAYFDQIIRIGITTRLAPGTPGSPYVGLLKNKKAYLFLVSGGYGFGQGEIYQHMDFLEPYLKALLQMLGVTDVTSVKMNHTTMGEEQRLRSYHQACGEIDALLKH